MTTYEDPASHASASARSIDCACFMISSLSGRRLRPPTSCAGVAAAAAADRLSVFIDLGLYCLHGSHTHNLDDDFLVFRAVVMMESGRVEHHAAGLDRDHLVGPVHVAFSGPPRPLDHRDPAVLS